MTFEDDELVLSTGRRMYCHANILGLHPRGGITYGYDGGLDETPPLTPAERREIAEYMAEAWTKWGTS